MRIGRPTSHNLPFGVLLFLCIVDCARGQIDLRSHYNATTFNCSNEAADPIPAGDLRMIQVEQIDDSDHGVIWATIHKNGDITITNHFRDAYSRHGFYVTGDFSEDLSKVSWVSVTLFDQNVTGRFNCFVWGYKSAPWKTSLTLTPQSMYAFSVSGFSIHRSGFPLYIESRCGHLKVGTDFGSAVSFSMNSMETLLGKIDSILIHIGKTSTGLIVLACVIAALAAFNTARDFAWIIERFKALYQSLTNRKS